MALVAVVAVVHIPTHVRMTEIRRVPTAVAIRALEHLVVARIGVTGRADPIRVPVVDWEIRVIESRSRPCRGGVAGRARSREPCRRVIRIGRAVVIRLVAAHARGRQRGVVVVHVAVGAGHGRVRPRQRERRRVVVERRSAPVCCAVAGIARVGEAYLRVVGIRRRGVVLLMAGHARRVRTGQIVVAVYMACAAGSRGVRARQGEARRRVVEGSIAPVGCGMALVAGLGEASLHVIRIRRSLEIRQVTLRARSAGQLVVVVGVALCTLQGDMRARQRKAGSRVIEGSVRPRGGGVALLASLRETRLHVVGIGGALEVFQVTRNTGRVGAGQVVVAIHVTLHALQRSMRTRQGEASGRVVKGRTGPRRGVVALLAGLGEPSRHVVGIGGALEVFQVATHASRIRTGEVVVIVNVALCALHRRVRAG